MKYCEKCKVKVQGNHEYCPLCKNFLGISNASERIFPVIPTIYEKHKRLILWLVLASFIVNILAILINYLTTPDVKWAWFVILGTITSWIIVKSALNLNNGFISQIFYQSLGISFLSIFWDITTGWSGWSVDFVYPAIIGICLINMFFVVTLRNKLVTDYLIYLLLEILLAGVPLIFLTMKLVNIAFPSIICVMIGIVSLLIIIVSRGKVIKEELHRRLHM